MEGRTFSFSNSHDAIIASTQFVKEREFWLNKLSGELVRSYFPYDYNRNSTDSSISRKDSLRVGFPGEVCSRLKKLSRGMDYTLHMIAAAVVVVLLDKYTYSGNKDIIIGAPIYKQEADANREFVNTVLALRTRLEENMTFKELLLRFRDTVTEADENKNYPIEVLITQLNMPKSDYDCPLFDVAVLLEGIHDIRYLKPVNLNMIFCFRGTGESVEMELHYNASRYRRATVERIAAHFAGLLQQVLFNVELQLTDIDITTAEEKKQLLEDFNDTAVEYPCDKTIHELFEKQAAKTPDSVAVVGARGSVPFLMDGVSITYGELNRKSHQLAHVLREKGVGPDTVVGIMTERSLEMIIGLLGILKAGGAYLPISPDYPNERIDYMLKDNNTALLLTAHDLLDVCRGTACRASICKGTACCAPTNLAYIIYTSGSTGRPKGVMVEHRNVVNLVHWFGKQYRLRRGVNMLQLSDYTFDASVNQIFSSLLHGAAVCQAAKDMVPDIEALRQYITEKQINIIYYVPGLLKQLFRGWEKPRCLQVVLSGAQVLEDELKNDILRQGYTLYNQYGPTEATVDTLTQACSLDTEVTLGHPIFNMKVYILDRDRHLLPVGTAGELWVSGAGVTRGYVNRSELTSELFVPDPFRPGAVMYGTGDLVKWCANGEVRFLGRKDHQVKIRGFRIELEEIENRLQGHQNVKEAVVIDREDAQGEKYLCAYIIPGDEPPGSEALRNYLSETLPSYMIPMHVVMMKALPLTPGGKVDRRSLPEPGHDSLTGEYAAPRDWVEKTLVRIWAEVLQQDPGSIGIDAVFFRIGGHSLKASVMATDIHKELGTKVPLTEVFRRQTIRELSQYIREAKQTKYEAIEPVEKREYYALSSAQKRLYFLQQMDLESTSYNMPLVLSLGKEVEKEKLESTLKKLIARHESLRTSFEMVNEEPVQRIYNEVEFEIEYFVLAAKSAKEREEENLIQGFIRPFDLSRAPLIRSGLIELADGYTWIVDIHHIVSDGTSHTILTEDFMFLYNEEELEPLRLQYKDFSRWQNHLFRGGKIKSQEDHWLTMFSGEIPRLNMPTDYKRPDVFTFAGANYEFMLDREDAVRLRDLATRNDATLYMNILTLLNTLFYKYTGQTDIIIGTGIAGRPHADLQSIIGMFVNTLAMRNHPEGEKTYEDLLKEVSAQSSTAYENQDVQFEELVDKLDLERDASRNPVFDMMMVVQNFRRVRERGPEKLPPVEYENTTAKFDMTFFVHEIGEDILINIEYYTAIFKRDTIVYLVRHFNRVIKEAVSNPAVKLEDIDIVSPQERQELLYGFNDTETAYPREKTIGELFEEQVGKVPDGAAVVFGEECLTYKVLAQQARQLTNYLRHEAGVVPDQRVGIMMDRSIDMIIAIFGILEAGGAYVPVSPSFPEERIKTMTDDAGIGILISQKRFIKILNRVQWECKSLDTFLCMDSEDVHGEEEVEESELMSRKLWEYVGETAVDEIAGGGWNSSYTGNPIPKAEMDEYGDNILRKLEPLLHKDMRVLEIGAASGISMYRIAPEAGLYYGTDLSAVIIEKNRERIEKQGHKNIKLRTLAAHEIHRLEEKNFELVILNSVVQCFHGHNYLGQVIRKAIDLMASRGYIFIGDIMDQELKEDLIADLVKFKQENRDKDYKTKIDWSEELFISRSFLEDLACDIPGIRDMEFSGKIYTIENELTRFRYDALIEVDKHYAESESVRRKERHKHQHDARELRKYGMEKFAAAVSSGNLSYVMYTSGSTGQPKGTLTTHYNVTRVVRNTNYIELQPGDRVLQLSDYAFDGSVFDIYGALLNGSTLVMVRREDMLEIEMLCNLIESRGISVFFVTTALFNTIVDVGLKSLSKVRKVLFGGERVSVPHAAKALAYLGRERILHVYGPTETTVYATYYPINEINENQVTIPIGGPISNTWIYILDSRFKLTPLGVTGEIFIGGPGVCKGYLHNETLTGETFIPDPFREGEIIYRTGDLGRWLSNGYIEFMGRRDHQVKVRGYRIELGEIESRLLSFIGIKECFVAAIEDDKGSRYLCAYVVGINDEKIEISELKDYLSQILPDFMVPSYVVQMDKLPLGRSGKIDRSKLPDPRMSSAENFAAPRDEIEEKVAALWSDVLGISRELIGIDSNFFELGGHSLKATVLTSKIHKALKVKVPLAEIFNRQTVRELCQYIRNAAGERFFAIDNAEEKEYYALSAAQKRLYIIQQMELESTRYNMPYVFPLAGDFDKGRLENTFGKLIRRHESFRTSFHMIDDKPVQRIHEKIEFKIECYDADIAGSSVRPFDLSLPPLLRVGLIGTGNLEHILMVEMHHIISDGTSQGILEREFAALYRGEELPPLRLQYRDYSQWQNSDAHQAIMKKQEKYWLKEFSGELPVLNLPADFPRPLMQSVEGRRLRFYIDPETTQNLYELSWQMEATLYMILLTVYNVLLAKLSGQGDIIIGTPTAGRRHVDLQDIIGMFVNTLSMRNYPEGEKEFIEFLHEVKKRTLDVYDNQEYQFEDLVDKISVRRDTGRNPIFDVMFNLLNQADYQGSITGEDTDAIYDEGEVKANFDIIFQGTELEGVIYFTVNYCTRIYKEETLKRFIRYFKRILSQITKSPTRKISSIELVSGEEKRQLLVDFNDTAAEYPADKTIHELFEEQAKRIPDHIAIVGTQHAVTYSELNQKSNQLAHLLREKGIKSDAIVGIMVERSPEMVIGILGTLKSGGAYLPIDPDYPEERINYMLKDSNTKVLLSEVSDVLDLSLPPASLAGPSNLAYVIYTSGSTGKPKGVMVEHTSVVNLITALQEYYPPGESGTYLLKTNYIFDVSAAELFGWFLGGGRLAVLEKGSEKDPGKILETIEREKVTHINFVPSMFRAFLEFLTRENVDKLSNLRYIFLAGEALSAEPVSLFRNFNTSIVLENIYGPTEGTVYASRYSLSQWRGSKNIPIGKPLQNVRIYILDKAGYVQPIGVPGELCLSGTGLSRGYLNRPELTAENFLFLSYKSYRSYRTYITKKIYKTGDLARWLPEGDIEFLGRMDQQVKIRGYRIELGEIESCLSSHPEVKEAVVVDRVDNTGNKYLCAYVVPNSSHSSHSSYLSYLSGLLPDYMVPTHVVEMAAIPLTPSGKVDRKALPEPEVIPGDDYTAPMNQVEEKLADIWSAVLGIDKQRIGATSNFFDIGGHSLRAIIVISQIHKELNARIPMLELFKTPTIQGLAKLITEAAEEEFIAVEAVEEKAYYPLSYNQKRLWFLQQIDPHSPSYHLNGNMMLNHAADENIIRDILYEIMERHESFRTAFKEVDNEPVQWIAETVDVPLEVVDITSLSLSEEEKKRKIEEFSARVTITPFDLKKPPLFRAALLELDEENAWFVFNMHHIITDGWSMEMLKAEFSTRYESYRSGSKTEWEPLALRYRDFAQWQNRYLNNPEVKERFQRFWREKLGQSIPPFKLPYDYKEVMRSPGSAGYRIAVHQEINERLQQLAKDENTTIYIVMLALLNILLARLSDQEDVMTGVLGAGREHLSLHNIVGFFVNTIILKIRVDYNENFPGFLRRVNEEVLEMMNYQDYPLELVFDDLNLRFPEISVLYNMFTRDPAAPGMELDSFESYHIETVQEAKFDLVFYVSPYKNGIDIQCHYRKDLFKKEKVEFIMQEYEKLSRYIAVEPDKRIKECLFEKRKKRKGWMKESRGDIS